MAHKQVGHRNMIPSHNVLLFTSNLELKLMTHHLSILARNKTVHQAKIDTQLINPKEFR